MSTSRSREDNVTTAVDDDQIEPGGRAAARGELALVQRFINTWNHEFPVGDDQLGSVRAATSWLRENGLADGVARTAAVTPADLDGLRDLREALRALAAANVTGSCDPAVLHTINTAAASAPAILSIDDDRRIDLHAHAAGVHQAIGTILAIIHDAQVAGLWTRFKGCRECGYAFYDASKNRSATWCSMSICGNRAKNRTYHQRQRTLTQA